MGGEAGSGRDLAPASVSHRFDGVVRTAPQNSRPGLVFCEDAGVSVGLRTRENPLAALAALAGVLILHHDNYLYAGLADPQSSINVFIMVIIGGLGSITGVFAGAIYLEGLTWFQGALPHSLQSLFQIMGSGIGLVVILMFLPGGVGSLIFKGRDRLLREFADRKRITVPSLIADSGVRDATPTMPLAEAPPAETAAVGSGASR